MRCAGGAAPPRRAHRARPRLRLPGALARAGAVLHRRGGVALPPRRWRGDERPSRAVPRCAGGLARRALGEKWAPHPRACAASSPARSRSSARRSAWDRAFRRMSRSSPSRPMSRRSPASTGGDLHHLVRHGARWSAARRRPSRFPTCPASASVRQRLRRARNASAAGASCPRSAPSPGIRDLCMRCAGAVEESGVAAIAAAGG